MSLRPEARRTFLGILLACACAPACNQILGIEPPTDRDGGAGGASGTTGAGGSNGGATGTGARGGTSGAAGAGATGGQSGSAGGTMGTGGRGGASGTTGTGGTGGSTMVPCASRQASDAIGIYVSASGADGASCGSRAQPCKTIQAGIGRAQTLGRTVVYVNAGTYAETLLLAAGIRIEGAWGAVGTDWSPICTAAASDAVVLQSPGAATTVTADALGGAAGLAYLTVKSKAAAAAGESLYGIVARGATTTLDLEQVKINVAAGGNGATAAKGANGDPGAGSGCDPEGDSAKGTDGTLATGASAGTFGSSGYSSGDGQTGMTGATGHNGPIRGTAPGCTSDLAPVISGYGCYDSCQTEVSTGGCTLPGADSCGTDGHGGCAGLGGKGGPAGKGGGSSIALYAWGATVNISGGSLAAAAGGQGSAGGLGGDGGQGANGSSGSPGRTCYYNYCQKMGSTCVGNPPSGMASRGSPGMGGKGGPGGLGGQGGGGAGGFSFAVYKGGGANVTVSGSTTLTVGTAGTSAGNGAPGVAKAVGP